jgi:Fe-S-cluster containining protein
MNKYSYETYLELREKIQQYQDKLGFECLRCKEGCCERNIERIPVLAEDVNLMKENGVELSGIERYQSSEFCLRRDPSLSHCYYFNREAHACTIHKHKPLYCLSYPFTFKLKEVRFLGKQVNEYHEVLFPNPFCRWIKEEGEPSNLENSLAKRIRALLEQMR